MQSAARAPVEPAFTARLIWYAMLIAIVAHAAVVAAVAGASHTFEPAGPANGLLGSLFLVTAVVQTVAVWWIDRRLLAPMLVPTPAAPLPVPDPQRVLSLHIVRWALGEAIGIYGVVLGLLAQSLVPALPFLLWSLGVIAYLRPRAAFFS